MKVFVAYKLSSGASGGGNQFLRTLKREFYSLESLTENVSEADVILFNAHHSSEQVLKIKDYFPNKLFVHRLAGVYKLYNNEGDHRQDIACQINKLVADGSIFISKWTMDSYMDYGLENKPSRVVLNCADNHYFNNDIVQRVDNDIIQLICTSWSINKNKGFEIYKYLDDNLDFSKYGFTYVGRDPNITFKNIKKIGQKPYSELPTYLKQSDIFITGTKHDACSNSLVEALSCGLPAVALNSGGSPEVIKKGGEVFDSTDDVIEKLEKVSENIEEYRKNIEIDTPLATAKKYLNFFEELMRDG